MSGACVHNSPYLCLHCLVWLVVGTAARNGRNLWVCLWCCCRERGVCWLAACISTD
jgi:hypothetical protein